MRLTTQLTLLALAALWILAFALWQGLPDRIPIHFGWNGAPDRFVDRSVVNWFLLPGLATLLVPALAFALPRWVLHLAATNSPLLNMPAKARYRALGPDARVRVAGTGIIVLRVIAIETALLFGYVLYGSAKVAGREWPTLYDAPIWLSSATIVLTALLSLPLASRAIAQQEQRSRITVDVASPR